MPGVAAQSLAATPLQKVAGGTRRAPQAAMSSSVVRPAAAVLILSALLAVIAVSPAHAQASASPTPVTVTCASQPGGRTQCAADTSKGVVLLQSRGDAPCLLGKSWGYEQGSVWVSDGCSAEFSTGAATPPADTKPKPLSHIPNVGIQTRPGTSFSGNRIRRCGGSPVPLAGHRPVRASLGRISPDNGRASTPPV